MTCPYDHRPNVPEDQLHSARSKSGVLLKRWITRISSRTKVKLAEQFRVSPFGTAKSTRSWKPHQRDMVRWMVKMGRAACFAAFGLGKVSSSSRRYG